MPMSGIGYGFAVGFGFSEPVKEDKPAEKEPPKEYPKAERRGNVYYYHPDDRTMGGLFPKDAFFLSSSPKK